MLQLGEEQHGDNDHHIEPGRLRGHNRRYAVSNEGDDDGSDAEYMVLRLLHVVVQPQQYAQHCAAAHEEAVVHGVEDIEQVTQDADEGEGAVGTEERSFPFALQADFPL